MDEILQTEDFLHKKAGAFRRSFGALYFRNFRMLWLGNIFIGLGQGADNIAIGWLMIEMTKSPFLVGAAYFCRMFPLLVLPPVTGVIADRLDRRKFLIIANSLFTVTGLTVTTLVLTGLITVWQILLGTLIAGIAFAMVSTARQSLMPSLVSRTRLQNAVAVYAISQNTSAFFAPGLAGMMISLAGIAAGFFLGAIGYAGALFSAILMRAPKVDTADPKSVWEDLKIGLRYVRDHKSLLAVLMLCSSMAFFGMSYQSMLAVLAQQVFHVDPAGYGFMGLSLGGGALAGSALLAIWGRIPNRGLVAIISLMVFSLAIVALSLTRSIYVAYAVLPIVGLSNAFARALANALALHEVPDFLRGRVMSIYIMTFGLQPLGSLTMGAIAQATNAPLAVGFGGVVTALSALAIAIFIPELRRLK
ncbi:MAG: MFS transporter [Dehalococcoidia bacterium]|nr:MFS transporter [Dehalococcoidia bacterium]